MQRENMMASVPANHSLKHNRPRRQRDGGSSKDTTNGLGNGNAPPNKTSSKAVRVAAPLHKRGGEFSMTKEQTLNMSADPPAAHDSINLLSELSSFDHMNIDVRNQTHKNGINNSASGSHSSGSGIASDMYSVSVSGSQLVPAASKTVMAVTAPEKQQWSDLHSKYFQAKGNRKRRPRPQAQPPSRGAKGFASNNSSLTTVTASMTENSLLRFSNSSFGEGPGGGGGGNAHDASKSLGSYNIPTFKNKGSRRSSRMKPKTYRMISGDNSHNQSSPTRLTGSPDTLIRNDNAGRGQNANPSIKEMKMHDSDDTLDNDHWMEEALLHGIMAANTSANEGAMDHELTNSNGSIDHNIDYPTKQLLGKLLDASERSLISAPPQSHERILLKAQSDLSSSDRDRQIRNEQIFNRRRSPGAVARSHNPARGRRKRSSVSPSATLSDVVEKSGSNGVSASRLITISDLTNPNISMEDLIKSHSSAKDDNQDRSSAIQLSTSHRRQHRHRDASLSPPHDHLPNIPTLPAIKTYKVTKNRPDEPAGLFLTKAKNGAVLVHSLSPESLFRKSTPLHPGQEVLSVNEKRVNDPKMAATLITQAKRNLSLRISTVERSRGFMYCQVKRRSGGAKVGAVDTNAAAGTSGGAKGEVGNVAKSSVGNVVSTALTVKTSTVGSRNRGRVSSGPSHHGVRFVTTSVDGVRRSTITEGLVRVSHIDPQGLFANSHPLNRLRVGGIVLTVNGAPVTNGREALEKVMGSRQLVEVLHCDERVWREDWVKDGMEQVLSGQPRKNPKEITSAFFVKEDGISKTNQEGERKKNDGDSNESMWDLEWKSDKEEVIIHKKGRRGLASYAFKLIFSDDVGTCHPELVNDQTMMPPTDEFDVSWLVKMVNESQRTMMTVLQNMLRRAKFELKVENGDSAIVAVASSPSPRQTESEEIIPKSDENRIVERRERINSCDALTELIEDEHGDVNEELCELADSLLRFDSRDRKRNTLRESQLQQTQTQLGVSANKDRIPRRGSTGFSQGISGISSADIEQWHLERYEDQPRSRKIREFSARQQRMDEQYNNSHVSDVNVGAEDHLTRPSVGSQGGSMFSADMLEDFMDYLDDVSTGHDIDSTPSNSSQEEGERDFSHSSPPSPRNDANKWDDAALRITSSQETSSDEETSPGKSKGDDEMAYITGVWRDVGSKYKISDKVVGSGGFGEVRDCYDKNTGQIYVVKTIFKPSQDDTTKINLIRNEILLLHEAHHPNIVELRDLFEDDKYVHIVMERCTGGDLFDRVVAENPRRLRSAAEAMKHEARTANSMRSILHVLKYLHSKGIVHRDIKPEHFLLTSDERETQKIKLIDFGLARKHKPGSAPMTTFTGSPSFVAPEVIARSYDHMCDMFSVGVTAYFMLTGMLPFDGPTDEETFDLISAGVFKFPASSVFLSDDAKDFITKLLETDPSKRMSALKALNHPWLLKAASC
mmetsp:Transcript_10275/g.22234  ORF Transcript_10275/g.22234 Transcript_10275/m.22234 type:complete len:1459 (+) Transcript_10275:437-4813(+)